MAGCYDFDPEVLALVADAFDFGLGVGGESIDRDDHRQAETADIFDVLFEVFGAFRARVGVGLVYFFKRLAAVEFERAHGGYMFFIADG